MARKRLRKRRRRSHRRRFRRQKSIITANKPGFFKLKGVLAVNASAGVINQFILTTNPAFFDTTNALQDWTAFGNLFDSYRVNAIKLKFHPAFPNQARQSVSPTQTPSVQWAPLYIVHETDSTTAIASENLMIQYDYPHLRTKNLYKPWKCFFKIPKYSSTRNEVNIEVITKDSYMDIANASVAATENLTGSIQWFATGLDTGGATYTMGTLLVTYYISFKNRR